MRFRLGIVSLLWLAVWPSTHVPAKDRGYNPGNNHDEAAQSVSLIQLISNPDKWDGRKVQVIGFLRLEFEGDALYLHEEDYDRGITKDSIWSLCRMTSQQPSELT